MPKNAFRFLMRRIEEMPEWVAERNPTVYLGENTMALDRWPSGLSGRIEVKYDQWVIKDRNGVIHTLDNDLYEALMEE